LGLLAAGGLLCGCPAADQQAAKPGSHRRGTQLAAAPGPADERQPASSPQAESEAAEQEQAPKTIDLGDPLVEDLKGLRRLDPVAPAWIDPKGKRVVMLAQVCRADYPLEFFATYPDRGYESVVVSGVKPSTVHAALLRLGAQPGHPVRFDPDFVPPTGTEIAIEVRWKDKDGKQHSAAAQQWVRNIQTKKALDVNWVFAGSGFWRDETTGQNHYLADGGDFISVLNLPSATLDLPIRSYSSLEARLFEGFVEHLPPEGTPLTLILTPKLKPANNAEKPQ
jgi:hypothetical protein